MISETRHENTLEVRLDFGKGNVLSLGCISELIQVIDSAELDHAIRAIIITGTGQSFSTGLNVPKELDASESSPWGGTFHAFDTLLVKLFRFPKPFVAAINGHSIGAGFLIQLCSDHTVVADNDRIKMGLPELSLGLAIDSVMAHLACYSFPNIRALQSVLYSSELFGPAKALHMTVIDDIVNSESLMPAACERCSRLIQRSTAAFCYTKLTLRSVTIRRMQEALANDSHTIFDSLLGNPLL